MTVSSAQTNLTLFGHSDIVRQLKNAYDIGRLHHALIFSGPKGVGKETLAFQLIRYILANPTGNPKQSDLRVAEDNRASKQLDAGSHPGLYVIEPAFDEKKQKYARDITLESLEGLNNFLRLSPTDDSARFVAINPADAMNRFTQNAILKMLEEPPQKTFFILITDQAGKLLPTIRSRGLLLPFSGLDENDFMCGLDFFKPGLSDGKKQSLYRISHGALGQALDLEQEGLLDLYGELCRAILEWQENDTQPGMHFAEQLAAQDALASDLYQLWMSRLGAVIKSQYQRDAMIPLIPEEQSLIDSWQKMEPANLLASYDRLNTLWREGESGYLDKKLIILKALGVLSGMDSVRPAVVT